MASSTSTSTQQLKPQIIQDGNKFYVFEDSRRAKLQYTVEIPTAVADFDTRAAQRARKLFLASFPHLELLHQTPTQQE